MHFTQNLKTKEFRLLIRWVLKTFWFPILLFILKKLSKTYPWAAKAYNALTKVAAPMKTVKASVAKKNLKKK